ncbi:hypothetical protein MA16_Dca014020 [Dendrobium catenatum]|uniref:Uncharacterized protein n=1 Tax=Dendrobium catenatum TaxID=906689 RepID=A0A2I0WZS2_9ASPA|nr:hypothetical protein MA16_Dca014020 [Dendrobium catenatum]
MAEAEKVSGKIKEFLNSQVNNEENWAVNMVNISTRLLVFPLGECNIHDACLVNDGTIPFDVSFDSFDDVDFGRSLYICFNLAEGLSEILLLASIDFVAKMAFIRLVAFVGAFNLPQEN